MVEYDASSRNITTGSFIACYILFLLVLRPFENLKITVRPPSFSLKLLEPNLSVLVGNTPGPLMAQGHAGAPFASETDQRVRYAYGFVSPHRDIAAINRSCRPHVDLGMGAGLLPNSESDRSVLSRSV